MIEFYPQIKWVHIAAVILSGGLFALRGLLMLARSRTTNHPALRYLSVAIDTTAGWVNQAGTQWAQNLAVGTSTYKAV